MGGNDKPVGVMFDLIFVVPKSDSEPEDAFSTSEESEDDDNNFQPAAKQRRIARD